MMDHVILISERAVEQQVLTIMLRRSCHGLAVVPVMRREDLDAVGVNLLAGSRIVGFCTDIIVPGRVLGAIGFGAYNFHPAPPLYPGWAPSCFAIRDRVRRYGATAHVMAPRIDTGEIVGTLMFDVPPGITLPALERMAYRASLDLFRHFAAHLAADERPLPPIAEVWGDRRCSRAAAKLDECPGSSDPAPIEQRRSIGGSKTATTSGFIDRISGMHVMSR